MASIADARAFCLRYHPGFLEWLERERAWVDARARPNRDAEPLMDILLICYARMALRNGSQSPSPLHYHNENHILELLLRLGRVIRAEPEWVDCWYPLAVFAAAHDLRQREPLQPGRQRGCGENEEASRDELLRLIEARYPALSSETIDCLAWSIEGSTFYLALRPGHCQGAWAAELVIQQKRMTAKQRQFVLLAADLDTANVAENFALLLRASLALARERLLLKPAESEQAALEFTRHFLETVQWHYMKDCQRFHSQTGRRVFLAEKKRNLSLMQAFTARLRAQPRFECLEQLESWYLQQAESLSRREPEARR